MGSGAFGVVYEAYDRSQEERVALKVLRTAEADALYRFKKDFRSLADIRHPNLASFYELFTESGLWFFSMELISGVDFIEYLLGSRLEAPGGEVSSTLIDLSEHLAAGRVERTNPRRPSERPASLPGAGRVRRVVRQLALGLHAVHQHGMVHRDIKPSNVLVSPAGDFKERVVLLDFGLVAELRPSIPGNTDGQLVGTPAYMSPEQALGLTGGTAGDWYAVGVMLYQALTGALPFRGSLTEIMTAKQISRAPSPQELRPSVPDDLEELCRGLLDPDPETRLSGDEVLARLDVSPPSEAVAPSLSEVLFVGRRALLKDLDDALEASRGGAVAVHVHGESGMGKTALIQRFADELHVRQGPHVVLTGRCYVQESVPYKALDNLIDNLARFLVTLPSGQVGELLFGDAPATSTNGRRDAAELARLFPVLRRVPSFENLPRSPSNGLTDPRIARQWAFRALRALLARLAKRWPLILIIDDLQWGDVDSFLLLDEILKGPRPPALLLVVSYRREDQVASPFLRSLAEHREALRWRGVDVREIGLERLSDGESRELLEVLESRGRPVPEGQVESVVREAEGSPLFLYELALYAEQRYPFDPRAGGRSASGGGAPGFQLRDVILARAGEVGERALRLLEVIAVAGQPVDLEVARQAAVSGSTHRGCHSQSPPDREAGWLEAVAQLRGQRLIREVAGERGGTIETYHDQIRESVVRALDARSLRQIHRRLAGALESSGRADPETLAVHFQATEEVGRARGYLVSAAERAEKALAFERAARLYRQALELTDASSERYRLQICLGGALANAGRGWEAAESYLTAVRDGAETRATGGVQAGGDPLSVQRRAAEKLLISGHVDRGSKVLRHVLRRVGMGFEDRRWKVLWKLRLDRLRLRLRGSRWPAREGVDCDSRALERIDICWSVAIGLCLVDVLQASAFHTRYLLLARAAGDAVRVARGLAMEAFFAAMEGREVAPASRVAEGFIDRIDDPYTGSLLNLAGGLEACAQGDWQGAGSPLKAAEDSLRRSRTGGAWALDAVRHLQVLRELALGRWRELFSDLPGLLEPAQAQGNLSFELHLRHWVESLRELAADRPERARSLLEGTIARWSQEGFHYQHFGHLYARVNLALYEGRGVEGWRLLQERWRELADSALLRFELVRVQSHDLRGRAALAAAGSGSSAERWRRRRVSESLRDAKQLERAGGGWGRALAAVLRAGAGTLDRAQGRAQELVDQLERAATLFQESGMSVHRWIVCRRLAQLECDVEGLGRIDAELLELGIRQPERLSAVLAPGDFGTGPPSGMR